MSDRSRRRSRSCLTPDRRILCTDTQGLGCSPYEATAYYVAAEAFTSAAKHAAASAVDILIERADGALTVQVRDDGVGGADAIRGSSLVGLRDWAEA
jgi:signal transduction histidine kinase